MKESLLLEEKMKMIGYLMQNACKLVMNNHFYSHGIKKRPFFTYVEMCFYHIILECPYEGVSFVFADKFTNILTILLDKCTTIDFCTMQ